MSLPLTTRYGSTPTVDEELANKAYVDASGGGGDKIICLGFTGSHVANVSAADNFPILWSWVYSSFSGNLTESLNTITLFVGVTIKRVLLRMQGNVAIADVIFQYRDDGVSVAGITVASATTGFFDSGDLTVDVATGSLVNWLIDFVSTGAIQDISLTAWGFET